MRLDELPNVKSVEGEVEDGSWLEYDIAETDWVGGGDCSARVSGCSEGGRCVDFSEKASIFGELDFNDAALQR